MQLSYTVCKSVHPCPMLSPVSIIPLPRMEVMDCTTASCFCLRRHAAAAAELPLPPTSRCRVTGLLLNIRLRRCRHCAATVVAATELPLPPPLPPPPPRCHCLRAAAAALPPPLPPPPPRCHCHRRHIPGLLLNTIIAPPPFRPRLVVKSSIAASSHPFPTKPSAHSFAHDVSNKFNEPEHVWVGHRRR
jgi:hypothetical protein